ncbi:MAG: bifunctional metallophosphatase/5'-nucleotidase [Firmicutes bacterium]|nr:bifunctional metallophosphatase/5'-nucleotidase [Bacillota bacterium]
MEKKARRYGRMLLILCLILTLSIPATAMAATEDGAGVITILYTNDVHTYMDNDGEDEFNYAKLATMKKQYKNVLLVDAGDHIQGTAYGSMDKGATVIKLMEGAGYDLATLGNHEFDYGMLRALDVAENSAFPYVSANFYNEKKGVKGSPVLDAYVIKEIGGKKIAFVGITTPETFTKSTPAYFQDEKGNYIYGISGGDDGKELYADVQKAIDGAKSAGADLIIALGHLGDDLSSQPWTSEEVIANTSGLDAFIDGHSHSTVEGKAVADKSGKTVVLTQTGQYLDAVGKMTIAADGTIKTELLTDATGIKEDEAVKKIQDEWITKIDEQLGQVIGRADVVFDNYDAEGKRLVRSQGTNTGEFAADALYYLVENMDFDVDVAIMNGGGVRNKTITGDISYKTCKEIHTFGNVACLQTITGQQLLDALEWGARDVGVAECGGFLHVSGLKYSINTEIASTVQKDDKGVWTGGPTGAYRVYNVQVLNNKTGKYEALDLDAKYNLAGYNYTLRDLGDGFAMFDGAVNVIDYVMEDYMVLANYVQSFKDGVITAENSVYGDVNGSGRIKITAGYDEEYIESIKMTLKSQQVKVKGKKAVKLTWAAPEGVDFDGFQVYRSTKKNSGYGTKPIFTTEKTSYTNTKGMKIGAKYYYKVRGFKYIDGEKVYTEYSTKAWRTIK